MSLEHTADEIAAEVDPMADDDFVSKEFCELKHGALVREIKDFKKTVVSLDNRVWALVILMVVNLAGLAGALITGVLK